MAAGRVRAAAVALAILVVAAIGWWLAGTGGRETGTADPERGSGSAEVSRGDTNAPRSPTPNDGERTASGASRSAPSGEGEPVAEDEPVERWIEGVCVLEDGTPLPGVLVSSVEWLKSHSGPTPGSWRSGLDGAFRIQASTEPVPVRHPSAKLVAVEGGEAILFAQGGSIGPAVRITGDTLRLTFRDLAGLAHVRLVNADTGDPVTVVKGLRIAWLVRGGMLTMGFPEDPGLGGWMEIPEGRLPETGNADQAAIEADLSKVEVEFRVPGFETARLPLKDIHGRMQVRVRPVPPDATGEILIDAAWDGIPEMDEFVPNDPQVTASLRWTGPDPAPSIVDVQGLPDGSGKFSVYGLPDGPWVLEVVATHFRNAVVRGGKAFEKHGSTVDLGTIELKPAGKVRIRVVDSADQPIPQAWAVIVRPDENPDQGRRLDLDDKGMVSVGDLEPGIGHRAVVKGLPRELEQTVVASAEAKPVEFKWAEKLVPCRITLLVDGKAVANADGRTTIPAVVQESPLPRDKGAWKSDGTFEAKLLPGIYKFSALATPKEGGALAVFAGEVTVPSGDAFEARLELTRGEK